MAQMMGLAFERIEHIVQKGENVGYRHLLLLLQYFQEQYSSGLLKSGTVERVQDNQQPFCEKQEILLRIFSKAQSHNPDIRGTK